MRGKGRSTKGAISALKAGLSPRVARAFLRLSPSSPRSRLPSALRALSF